MAENDYAGEMDGFDTLTEEQKAAILEQQGQPGPGVPMAPPPPPVQSAPYDPGQSYDQAALSGPGPAASAAWDQYTGTGQTSSPARVYPPVKPGALDAKTIKGPAPYQVTEPGDQAIRLAENMGVPLQQAIQAIDAQQRYQAQRGYQADLDRGVSAEQAAVKWFPLMLSSTTTKGGAGMPGFPGMLGQQKPPQSRNIAGVLYERNPASGSWAAVTAPKVNPPRATSAVVNRHKALMAEEIVAKQAKDPRAVRDALMARQAFESEHPELGLSAGGAQAAPTATGTMPPTAPTVAPPRNRIYSGPNIQAPGQSDAQFMGDIPRGARAGAMNAQAGQSTRPPVSTAPTPIAEPVATPRVAAPAQDKAAFPPAPATAAQRKAGQTYSTSKGNFTWTGSGWKKAPE